VGLWIKFRRRSSFDLFTIESPRRVSSPACYKPQNKRKMSSKYEKVTDEEESTGLLSRVKDRVQSVNKHTMAKIGYCVILVIAFLLALAGRDGLFGVWKSLSVNYWNKFCDAYSEKLHVSCEGPYFVYRISFGCVIFYFINAVLASPIFCVPSSVRIFLQTNVCLWVVRFLSFIPCVLIPFVIRDEFFYGFGWISIFVSGVFILIQLIVLIDFVHTWQENWLNTGEDDSRTVWQYLLVFFGVIFFLTGAVLFIAEIFMFGIGKTCWLNRLLIITTGIVGIGIVALSVLTGTGILPGTFVFAYAQFYVWMAITSNPDTKCNRWSKGSSGQTNETAAIITASLSIGLALFSVVKNTVSTSLVDFCVCRRNDEDDDDKEEDLEAETARREAHTIFLGLVVFIFSSFYFGTVLNNWMILDVQADQSAKAAAVIDVSIVSFIVKVISVLAVYLLFVWTVVGKYLCRCRDFGDDSDDEEGFLFSARNK